jgi:hypothetical protein
MNQSAQVSSSSRAWYTSMVNQDPLINGWCYERDQLVKCLISMVNDVFVDDQYPSNNLVWVKPMREIAEAIVRLDPNWRLECVTERYKSMVIKHPNCFCDRPITRANL